MTRRKGSTSPLLSAGLDALPAPSNPDGMSRSVTIEKELKELAESRSGPLKELAELL